jgi:threonylcarbamoyladenosine tRNA methylthiotransferase MtaB
MKLCIKTLGCKVNAYESECIEEDFKNHGYEVVSDTNDADVIVVNTCTVTNQADAKSRKIIRGARKNENACLVVCGCSSQQHKDSLFELGVDILLGTTGKTKIYNLVNEWLENKEKISLFDDVRYVDFEKTNINDMDGKTRAFVKIQDGCNNFCSYCIIPFVRGRVRSKAYDVAVNEINTLANNGYKEVVLTGIHTGHYGEDGKTSFSELLSEIVKIKKLKRLRISSIEITELNDDFLDVLRNNLVIVDHLHIPLQAGSDKVLKEMNRKYDKAYYLNKINEIRMIRPNISITTDVIVGFPGETEEEFNETCEFCREIGFSKIHVFPYSRRTGTKADLMPNQIDERIKKERVAKLINVSDELEINYLDKFINQKVEVLVEKCVDGKSFGHTGNYLEVEINGVCNKNTLVCVIIKKRNGKVLEGEIYEEY